MVRTFVASRVVTQPSAPQAVIAITGFAFAAETTTRADAAATAAMRASRMYGLHQQEPNSSRFHQPHALGNACRIEALGGLADAGVEQVRVALERDQRAGVAGHRLDELDIGAGGDEP